MNIQFCSNCGSKNLQTKEYGEQCQDCKKEFYNNPKPTVGVVINCQNKFLLAKRGHSPGKGQWAIIADFVDHKETLEEALLREIQEELSIKIDPNKLKYLGNWNHSYQYKEDNFQTLLAVFGYNITEYELTVLSSKIKINSENTEFGFLNMEELNSLDQSDLLFRDNFEIVQKSAT
jgi:8-oxo-dGTP pyrophosphatase MutT (NUDIX family)